MSFVSPIKLSVVCIAVGSVLLLGCGQRVNDTTNAHASATRTVQVPERYQVRFGDTVSGISARYGLNWREVSAINRLDSKHTIFVGQWLVLKGASRTVPRIPYVQPTTQMPYYPPVAKEIPTKSQPQVLPLYQPKVDVLPLYQPPQRAEQPVVIAPVTSASVAPVPVSRATPMPPIQPEVMSAFLYPANPTNVIVKRFGAPLDNGITEGVFLAGRAGDVILASKTGVASIVKAGTNERPMIVLEHEGGYSTTYLDVRNTNIRPRQTVRAGEPLGVMTSQTASGLALFEFRVAKNGRYIDPIAVLP